MTEEQAHSVIQILNEECNSNIAGYNVDAFISYFTKKDGLNKEWRFMGALGFGGKCKFNSNFQHPYVDCYREHETPEILDMITKANDRLADLFAKAP